MSAVSSSTPPGTTQFWPIFWLFLSIVAIPYVVTQILFILFPELPPIQFEVWSLMALFGLVAWIWRQGAGWRLVDKDSTLIKRDPMSGGLIAHEDGSYLFIPIIHKIVARLPNYPFRFEPIVEQIDTQTPMLVKISKLRVRVDCRIKPGEHLAFFMQSASRLDRMKALQEELKLDATSHALWKAFIGEVMKELVDDAVRDVVWTWSDSTTNDPTNLSKQRRALAFFVQSKLEDELDAWGLELLAFHATGGRSAATGQAQTPSAQATRVVLEAIEVDPEVVKNKMRDYDRMLKKATEDATIEAEAIKARGKAEAEVRAANLAAILDVLINKYDIPHTDPLIGQVVRASLYSDGEMIWKGVLEKSTSGNGTTKAA